MYQVIESKEMRDVTHLPDGSIICACTIIVVLKEVPDNIRLPNCVPMIGDGFIWFKTME